MGNNKNWVNDFFPPMPDWGWDNEEQKEKWEEFKSNVGKLWDQYQDMQKAAEKAWKEQWETFFAQLMDMQQTVADALPDEKAAVPGIPAAPVSPKEIVEKAKEFQEKANAHAVERADTMVKFRRQRRQQVKSMVSDAVQNVEAGLDAAQPVKEEKAEKKPAEKAEKKAEKKPVKKADAKPEKKAEAKPEKKTAAKSTGKTNAKTAKKPAAKSTAKPAAKSAAKPAAKPAEKPAEKSAETPAEKPAE